MTARKANDDNYMTIQTSKTPANSARDQTNKRIMNDERLFCRPSISTRLTQSIHTSDVTKLMPLFAENKAINC